MAPKAKAAAAAPAKAEPKAKGEPKKKKVEKSPEDEEKRVPPPDREAFNEKVQAVNADIEKLNKEQAKLTERINERSGGKNEFFAKKGEIQEQLGVLSGKMNDLQAQKEEIQKVIGDKKEEGREMRSQLNKMKKSIGYNTEAEIDERIATIEFKLWTESVALKDEKKMLQEIQELKRNRPKVSQVHKMEEGLETFSAGMPMKDKIASINEEMAKYRDQKRAVQEKLKELTESRKEQLGDLPQILDERTELGKKIQEKIKERNQLRDDFKAEEQAYYAWQAEERRKRQERQQEERQKWQAEQKQRMKLKKAESLDEQPYVAEITLIEQTISFCKSLTATKATEDKAEKEEKDMTLSTKDGDLVPLKKDDEYYFAPTAKGKKGKSNKKGGKEGGSSKPIKHNAETFRLFDQLKLDAPITTDDIPATLEKLEAQLDDYNKKVAKWEETREEMKRKILEGEDEEEKAEEKEEEKEEKKEEEKEEEKPAED